jgi:hypothetical protein
MGWITQRLAKRDYKMSLQPESLVVEDSLSWTEPTQVFASIPSAIIGRVGFIVVIYNWSNLKKSVQSETHSA